MPRDANAIPDVAVKVDGQPLDNLVALNLVEFSVELSVDLPGVFTLDLRSEHDGSESWFDSDTPFSVGSKVELAAGVLGEPLTVLMHGEITALEAEFGAAAPPRLSVRGHDLRHRLQRGRRVRTFTKMKDSAIARQIAGEAGIRVDAVDSKELVEYLIQANQTDFEFLTERARRIGYELSMDDERLQFRPAPNLREPSLELSMDDGSLDEFRVGLSSAGQVVEATVRGWDVKQKKTLVSRAQASQLGAMGKTSVDRVVRRFGKAAELVATQPVAGKVEADALAAAVLGQRLQPLLRGEGLCVGNPQLRVGRVVGIEGVGKRFGGSYYVAEARHRVTADSGYTTRFTAWRNAL